MELFFPKTATNKGSGSPNWFHYWQIAPVAVADLPGFVFISDPESCGHYYPTDDVLGVHEQAAEGWDEEGELTLYNHYYQTHLNAGEDGFASIIYEGDDNQILPFFDPNHNQWVWHEPYAVAILPGADGVIDTVALGNDRVVQVQGEWVLDTGWDGELASGTTISPNDEWKIYEWYDVAAQQLRQKHIDPGWGRPWAVCVTCGPNGYLESRGGGDERIDLANAHIVTWTSVAARGIDSCAITCRHELEHQALYEMIRLPGGPPYSYDPTGDQDYVSDDYEVNSSYHLSPYHQDTYGWEEAFEAFMGEQMPFGWQPENEFCAYMTEDDPGHTYPDRDWSDTDGKNWDHP